MTLPGFPVPTPNEAYTSVVARQLARSARSKSRILKSPGFQKAAVYSVCPNNINVLESAMPSGYPWSNDGVGLVVNNTTTLLQTFFAGPARRVALINRLSGGLSERTSASLGTSTHSAALARPSHRAKFCRSCVELELDRFGYSVGYRFHLPGFVKYCAIHKEPLFYNCTTCPSQKCTTNAWRMAGTCECGSPVTPSAANAALKSETDAWMWLATQAHTILTTPPGVNDYMQTKLINMLKASDPRVCLQI
jgi:hypothetical protein